MVLIVVESGRRAENRERNTLQCSKEHTHNCENVHRCYISNLVSNGKKKVSDFLSENRFHHNEIFRKGHVRGISIFSAFMLRRMHFQFVLKTLGSIWRGSNRVVEEKSRFFLPWPLFHFPFFFELGCRNIQFALFLFYYNCIVLYIIACIVLVFIFGFYVVLTIVAFNIYGCFYIIFYSRFIHIVMRIWSNYIPTCAIEVMNY